ncbi:MAG: hypothetical protein KF888_08130 [Nitrosomonas sp.]|nr:hypothetical protein [Nitrosomonas sp.]
MKKLSRMVMALIIGTLTGCATIMGTDSHNMPVRSSPSDATITITDETGSEVYFGKTPTTVMLKKSNGKYFGRNPIKSLYLNPATVRKRYP